MRILELFELEERCFLFSLLISLDIIQGPTLVACSNLLVILILKALDIFCFSDGMLLLLLITSDQNRGNQIFLDFKGIFLKSQKLYLILLEADYQKM